ncbi:NAD(P)-binding protein [Nemania sp. FL0031]|nr:NAD(P)-binding protein [Nemania sp. FL0031]
MAGPKILITGASGYVGGTVLSQFLASSITEVHNASFSVLVRKQEQADRYGSQGITPYLLSGLEDTEAIRQLASQFDIIVHLADSSSLAASEAMIYGLRDGAQKGGDGVKRHFIHLSGTSSLGDLRNSKPSTTVSHEFSDKRDDIYSYMKWLESIKPYRQRTTDLRVIDAGEETDVKTYVVKAPRIYGRGTGLYNQKSVQIPILIRGAIAAGKAEYIGPGTGIWDDVHVADVATFFELLLGKILKNEHVPTGPKPFFFIQSIRHSWKEVAEGLAVVGAKKGLLQSTKAQSIGLLEAAEKYTGGDAYLAEVGLASNSVTKADLAHEMGWTSRRTEADFQQSLVDDFVA